MKKLFAIALILALVTGAVFAQVSGAVEARMFVSGDTSDIEAGKPRIGGFGDGGGIATAHIQLAGQNDEGTLGGLFRFRNVDVVRADPWFHRAFIWWRPIPQLRIFAGIDQDGQFSTGQLTDWAFHQGFENFICRHDWGFWRDIFLGHWDGFGVAFTVNPAQGVQLNLVVPTGGTGWPQATAAQVNQSILLEEIYAHLQLTGSVTIPDVGRVYFGYMGPQANFEDAGHYGRAGGSFYLTAIQGVPLQLGVSTNIPKDGAKEDILVGFATHYTGEGFGVKFRLGAVLQEENTRIDTNVMPWYSLDKMTAFLDLGINLNTSDTENMGWWVNPYVKMPLGGGQFTFGARIFSGPGSAAYGGGTAKDVIRCDIPMSLLFNF